jgi:TP901 family phage tail tape measure protein
LGIGVLVAGFKKLTTAANDFNESVANLSALTGLAGKELEYLSDRAKDFAGSVTEDGIRITKSALSIVDAYTQMGSKRPELLKDKEALASVTEQAIILSQAAKMELVPATNSLAISMNQFNAEAKEAPRYINAIAAGSKEGAGDVLYIAAALEKSGTSMKLAGLNIEEGIGLIETLAPKFSEATMAGTQLKNVMIKLQMSADKFNPEIVGMETALDNLAGANLSVTELTKLFGLENLNAAQTLIEGRDEFVRYRDAVTDTNVAIEQAIINTSTEKAKLEAKRQELNKYVILLGEKLAPALTFSTGAFADLVKGIITAIKFLYEYRGVIIPLTTAIIAYTVVTKASVVWDKIKVFWTDKLTKTTKNLFKTLKANPYGLIVAAIVALITILATYKRKLDETQAAQKALNDVNKQALKDIVDEKLELEKLLTIAKDETRSKNEREEAIIRLNELSPEYLGNLTLEEINTNKAKKATDEYIKSLEEKARVIAAQEKLIEIEKELIDLHLSGTGAEITFWQGLKNSIFSFGILSKTTYKNVETALDNITQKERELLAIKEALLGIINQTNEAIIKDPEVSEKTAEQKTIDDFIADNEKEFKAWKQARGDYLIKKQQYEKQLNAEYEIPELEEEEEYPWPWDDPATKAALLNQQYVDEQYALSLEGREEILNEMLARGEISELEHADKVKAIHKEAYLEKVKLAELYLGTANKLGNALLSIYSAQKNKELEAAGDNEEKKEAINRKYAKKEQTVAAAQARIAGALAIMRIWAGQISGNPLIDAIIKAALTAVQIITTEAQVADIKAEQFELGNYLDVIGATDKKKYRAKMGEGTGLYDDPTLIPGLGLVAEKQPEIVFSGPDTQKILNAPGLIDAINYTLRAPQFAAGQTQTIEKHTTETITQPLLSDDMVDAMNRFSDTVDKLQSEGIKSKLVWSEFEEFQTDNEEIEESVNMRD